MILKKLLIKQKMLTEPSIRDLIKELDVNKKVDPNKKIEIDFEKFLSWLEGDDEVIFIKDGSVIKKKEG